MNAVTIPEREAVPSGRLGVFLGLSFADYLADPALSCSGLKKLRKSPAHFLAGDDPSADQKPALRRGSLLHTLGLEPRQLLDRYVVKPAGMNFATKEGKSWRDATRAGMEIVTTEELATASRQASALRAVPEIAGLLGSGSAEVSFFWVDPATGMRCKGRADWVFRTPSGVVLLDLKTCEDASPFGFSRACARYSYHLQASWYSRGWTLATQETVLGFVFGAVESGWPHIASAYMLDDDSLQRGRDECRRLALLHAECTQSGRWPGYVTSIETINLPEWA